MKKTTYYKLNQWDENDRVLRTDFNADNAAVDTALRALFSRGCFESVCALTNSGSGRQISFVLPAINWSDYFYVLLDSTLAGDNGSAWLRLNGAMEGQSYSVGSGQINPNGLAQVALGGRAGGVLLPVHKNAARPVQSVFLASSMGLGSGALTYGSIASIGYCTTDASLAFAPGSKLTVWGIR